MCKLESASVDKTTPNSVPSGGKERRGGGGHKRRSFCPPQKELKCFIMLSRACLTRSFEDGEDHLKKQILSTIRTTPVSALVQSATQIVEECCSVIASNASSIDSLAFAFSVLHSLLGKQGGYTKAVVRVLTQSGSHLVQAACRCYSDSSSSFSWACAFFTQIIDSPQQREWKNMTQAFVDQHILCEKLFSCVYGMPREPKFPRVEVEPCSLACLKLISVILDKGGDTIGAYHHVSAYMLSCFAHHLMGLSEGEDEAFVSVLTTCLRLGMSAAETRPLIRPMCDTILSTFATFAMHPQTTVTSTAQYAAVLSLIKLEAPVSGEGGGEFAGSRLCCRALQFITYRNMEVRDQHFLLELVMGLITTCDNVLLTRVLVLCQEKRLVETTSQLCHEMHHGFLRKLFQWASDINAVELWLDGDPPLSAFLQDVVLHAGNSGCMRCFKLLQSAVLRILGYQQQIQAGFPSICSSPKSLSTLVQELLTAGLAPSSSVPQSEALLVVAATAGTAGDSALSRDDCMRFLSLALEQRKCTPSPMFTELILQRCLGVPNTHIMSSREDVYKWDACCRAALATVTLPISDDSGSFPLILSIAIANGQRVALDTLRAGYTGVYLRRLEKLWVREMVGAVLLCTVLDTLLGWMSGRGYEQELIKTLATGVLGMLRAKQPSEEDACAYLVDIARRAHAQYVDALKVAKRSHYVNTHLDSLMQLHEMALTLLCMTHAPQVYLEAISSAAQFLVDDTKVSTNADRQSDPLHVLELLHLTGIQCTKEIYNSSSNSSSCNQWDDVASAFVGLSEDFFWTISLGGVEGTHSRGSSSLLAVLLANLLLRHDTTSGQLLALVERAIRTETEAAPSACGAQATTLTFLLAALLQRASLNCSSWSAQMLLRAQEYTVLYTHHTETTHDDDLVTAVTLYRLSSTDHSNCWTTLMDAPKATLDHPSLLPGCNTTDITATDITSLIQSCFSAITSW